MNVCRIIFILSIVSFYSYAGNSKRVFNWAMGDIPSKIDPLDWRSLERWFVLNQVFDTLVTYDKHYALRPILAKKWIYSKNRLEIKFELKEMRFSDGSLIQSDDVVYSLKRYLLTQPNSNLFKRVILDGLKLKKINQDIEGLKIINDREFLIKLKNKFENIWSYLSFPNSGGIVKKESIDLKTLDLKDNVGSGDYFVERKTDNLLVLRLNRYRHKNNCLGCIEKAIIRKSGSTNEQKEGFFNSSLDLLSELDPFMLTDKEAEKVKRASHPNGILKFPNHRVGFLYLNKKRFSSQIERSEISNNFSLTQLRKNPVRGISWSNDFFPQGSPGHVQNDFKAKSEKNRSANKESLKILLEKGLNNDFIEAMLKKKLAANGYEVSFFYQTKKQISQRISRDDFDAVFITLGFPIADHEYAIYLYFVEEPWYLKSNNLKVVEIFRNVTLESLIVKKSKLMKKISSLILRENLIIPIFHTSIKYFLSKRFRFRDINLKKNDFHLINVESNE